MIPRAMTTIVQEDLDRCSWGSPSYGGPRARPISPPSCGGACDSAMASPARAGSANLQRPHRRRPVLRRAREASRPSLKRAPPLGPSLPCHTKPLARARATAATRDGVERLVGLAYGPGRGAECRMEVLLASAQQEGREDFLPRDRSRRKLPTLDSPAEDRGNAFSLREHWRFKPCGGDNRDKTPDLI